MIKHKIIVASLLILLLIGGALFVAFATGTSYDESNTDDVALYPEDDETEFLDDSENEPMPMADSPPKAEDSEPGTVLEPEVIEDKLGIPAIEEEQIYYLQETDPNDPHYPQWYLSNLDANKAWDISTGSSAVTVAVIDSGYALEHEDLTNAWAINAEESGNTQNGDPCWTGSPENKATNGCDDDLNGFIDDARGWDFSNNDNSPQAGEGSSGATHGTKVAGLVGATGNNGTGVVALDWNTRIMPIQGLFDAGFGFTSDIVAGIIYAVDNGADIINMSLGSPSPDTAMLAAIEYAHQNNVIVVAAAGNCGNDPTAPDCLGSPNPGGMLYPGRYEHVISAGATTSSDTRAGFSSFGPELDFMAPGSGTIRTTTWTSSNETSAYATSSYGTSFASPIISSLVALIKSELPYASFEEVYQFLDNGVDKVPGMGGSDFTNEYGFGRINAFKTMQEVQKRIAALDKGSGIVRPVTEKPTVATSKGHVTSQKVGSTDVLTWCVTAPNTDCTVNFDKQGSSTSASLPTRRTDSQGIAVWAWSNSDIGSGTWNVTATAGGLTSSKEVLFVN